jgi:CRISPR/Cas system-associated exonuclease Cas4 (RecB family)
VLVTIPRGPPDSEQRRRLVGWCVALESAKYSDKPVVDKDRLCEMRVIGTSIEVAIMLANIDEDDRNGFLEIIGFMQRSFVCCWNLCSSHCWVETDVRLEADS